MVARLVLFLQPISILHHSLFLCISSWSGWSPSSSLCCWTLTLDWLLPSDSQCSLSSSGHSCKNALPQGSHTHNYTLINTHTRLVGVCVNLSYQSKHPKKQLSQAFYFRPHLKYYNLIPFFVLCVFQTKVLSAGADPRHWHLQATGGLQSGMAYHICVTWQHNDKCLASYMRTAWRLPEGSLRWAGYKVHLLPFGPCWESNIEVLMGVMCRSVFNQTALHSASQPTLNLSPAFHIDTIYSAVIDQQ